MSSKLPGVAIFGTEESTHKLVPLLKREGFQVLAVWGRILEEAQNVAQTLGIAYSTNQVDDILLLKGVDLIVILCPPSHHAQIAVKALGIGKHVTVQSPGGLNQEESLRMVQAAQYYPRLLSSVNCGLRFVPAFEKMKSAIAFGLIGPEIKLCDVRISMRSLVGKSYSWMCDDAMGGGLLNTIGSQIIDLLHFLTGQKAVRVHGNLRTLTRQTEFINGIRQINADDLAMFDMDLAGGTFATVTLNSQLSGFSQEIFLCGSEGHIVARNSDLYGWTKGALKEERIFEDMSERKSDSKTQDSPLLSGMYLEGLANMFKHLSTQFTSMEDDQSLIIEDGVPTGLKRNLANFEDARYVQAVIQAIRKSSSDRTWTKVVYDAW